MPEDEKTNEKPTEEKTEPEPKAALPPAPPEPEEDDVPQIDEGLRRRFLEVQERFLKRDVTIGALIEADEISEFMFNVLDNASTAKAIKEVCGLLGIEVDDFFATYGFDPEGGEDEDGEEGDEEFDEEEDEPEEEAPAPPPEPKKAKKERKFLESDLIK